MACPFVLTGDQFVIRSIEHVDCQTRDLASIGYFALSEPGSTASIVVASLLTLFIALFGIRLLFGPMPGARDIVFDVLTIGIVLTLAFSWPAFRTLVHDVTLDGPGELATSLTPAVLSSTNATFNARLQEVNDAMASLTALGTGRNVGQFVNNDVNASFQAAAIEDDDGLGYGRTVWLAGVIGVLLPLRFLGGILLALAPLAAALLLFEATRGLFAGWLRGLVFALVGTLAITLMLGLELSLLEPYLADALRVRQLGYAVPSVPTELLALALAFLIAKLLLIAFFLRVAFYRGWTRSVLNVLETNQRFDRRRQIAGPHLTASANVPRAQAVARAVEARMAYEEASLRGGRRIPTPSISTDYRTNLSSTSIPNPSGRGRSGLSGRRSAPRVGASAAQRDAR